MKQLEIHGYKSIKDLVLPLREINILIGANGSGKSNLLSFFVFLKTFYNRNLQESVALSGGMDKFLYMGRKITSEISIKLLFPKNAYSFTLVAGEDAFVITKEGLWYGENPYIPNPIDIASFSKESRLQYATEPRADYIRNYLSELKKYHFHDTSKNSPFTKVSNVKTGGHYLLPQGENLAAFLYTVSRQTPKNYNLIVQTISVYKYKIFIVNKLLLLKNNVFFFEFFNWVIFVCLFRKVYILCRLYSILYVVRVFV
mgnify:CR=1 FL=1